MSISFDKGRNLVSLKWTYILFKFSKLRSFLRLSGRLVLGALAPDKPTLRRLALKIHAGSLVMRSHHRVNCWLLKRLDMLFSILFGFCIHSRRSSCCALHAAKSDKLERSTFERLSAILAFRWSVIVVKCLRGICFWFGICAPAACCAARSAATSSAGRVL